MKRVYDGKSLARVLLYYGIVDSVERPDFNVNCPFHDDPNPSMMIRLMEGNFYCFGCGLGGNAYDFVRYANPTLDDLQCLVVLEKILHSESVGKLEIRYKKRKRANKTFLMQEAEDYYYGLRKVNWFGVLNDEEKKVFDYMKARGFSANALHYAGCRATYNVAYPMVFPVLDNGAFRGWVGRTTKKSVEKVRKYLYNEGFRKRDTLCGSYNGKSVPVLCEGFFDYLSLVSKTKIRNAVAILGWHLSDEQAVKLQEKGIESVVCALDNPEIDKAGEKGIRVLEKYFAVQLFPYPKGVKDMGEMSKGQLEKSLDILRGKGVEV